MLQRTRLYFQLKLPPTTPIHKNLTYLPILIPSQPTYPNIPHREQKLPHPSQNKQENSPNKKRNPKKPQNMGWENSNAKMPTKKEIKEEITTSAPPL
jgi:hypothetical protein